VKWELANKATTYCNMWLAASSADPEAKMSCGQSMREDEEIHNLAGFVLRSEHVRSI
jgi:hypothetical protein